MSSLCIVFRCVYEIIIDGSVDFDLYENAVSVSVLEDNPICQFYIGDLSFSFLSAI